MCASKEPHVRLRDVNNQTFQLLLSDPSTDNWKQEEFFSSVAPFMTSCYIAWNELWCSSERKLNTFWGNIHNQEEFGKVKSQIQGHWFDSLMSHLMSAVVVLLLKLWMCSWPGRRYRVKIFQSTAELGDNRTLLQFLILQVTHALLSACSSVQIIRFFKIIFIIKKHPGYLHSQRKNYRKAH